MRKFILSSFLLFMAFTPSLHASEVPDAQLLQGLSVAKVVWDIKLADPKKLLLNFRVIRQTYDDLERANVRPDMVFAFRGPVVRLISSEPGQLSPEDAKAVETVQQLVGEMVNKPGVAMQACGISTQALGVENSTLLPGIAHVGNSFLSLIGYQARGYALIVIQ
jgi:intracellular sulfur oxidation DsrE/DsrF family protein